MNDDTPTDVFITNLEGRIDSGELILDDELLQKIVQHRRAVFKRLLIASIKDVPDAFHKLIYLFSVEAVCVELQLMPFADGLRKIAVGVITNNITTFIFGAISCAAICAHVIHHW
ncbi:MAG: hypothetical protein WAU28_03235 [Candidatus Moraniibacteriota bacterium]